MSEYAIGIVCEVIELCTHVVTYGYVFKGFIIGEKITTVNPYGFHAIVTKIETKIKLKKTQQTKTKQTLK